MKIQTIIRFAVIFALTVLLFIYLYPFLKYSVAWGESLYSPYISNEPLINPNSLLQLFTANDHSWFFYSFIFAFTNRYMPVILNMHHQDYMNQFNIYLMLAVYILFIMVIQFNFEKNFRDKTIPIFAIFIITPILLIIQSVVGGTWWFNHDCWYWAYIGLPIIPIYFYAITEKMYVNNEFPPDKKRTFLLFFLIFLIGVGHDFYRIVLLTALPILVILNNIFAKRKYSIRNFILIYAYVLITNLFLYITAAFHEWYDMRYRTTEQCINIVVPFLKGYFQTVVVDNAVFYMLFVILSVIMFITQKRSEESKKLFIFLVSVLAGVLFFNLIIILGHETNQFEYNHQGVKFLTKTMLLCINLSVLGFLLNRIQSYKQKLVIIFSLLILIVPFIYKNRHNIETYEMGDYEKKFREKMYLMEKLFYCYGLNSKEIYLYDDASFPVITIYDFLYRYDSIDNIDDYKIIYVEDNTEKFKKLFKDKTGFDVSEKELSELKFSNIKL